MLKLIIGNRNYSSWSLRAWLYMAESGLELEVVRIPMFTESWASKVSKYSPAGRVPVLLDGDVTVWDSTAIIQHLSERFSDVVGWPEEPKARAHARSVSAEMHSGFIAIRGELPQNIRRRSRLDRATLSAGCNAQIDRVFEIWSDCRSRYSNDGPWLFGTFSIADVMFAPVALRFQSYGIDVPQPAAEFLDAVTTNERVQEWSVAAEAEAESIEFIDNLTPADASPLTLG